jgi:hypothetical protein
MSRIATKDKRVELMRFYSGKGKTLAETIKFIGIQKRTAQEYAKTFSIPFSDYRPRVGGKV